MSRIPEFIIIDDSQLDTFIASKMIRNIDPEAKINTFTNAKEAIEWISNEYTGTTTVIMFVDINMPVMNGFEFMEEFEKIPGTKTQHFHTVILTSSINEADMSVAKTFPTIKQFINKPLSQITVSELIENVNLLQ